MKKLYNFIKEHTIEILILAVVIVILVNSLFINPAIGKSDNGDFGRLALYYGGLSYTSDIYSEIYDRFVHMHYLISTPSIFLIFYKDWVSESILLKIAVFFSLITHGFMSRIFDIRYLAFVYSVIFLLAVFFIVRFKKFSIPLKIAAGAYIILCFTDTSYISYFNSFFGEAGTIVFFFLTIGTYLNLVGREKPDVRHFVYFFIASGGFLTSKAQEIPLLVFMIVIYAGLFWYYREKKQRKCILTASLIVVLLCGIAYVSISKIMNQNNIYQSVFSGVLRGSRHPEKDLEELGIDRKFMVFYGQSFYNRHSKYNPIGEEMQKEFYPKVSQVNILSFYMRHPDRLWQKIEDSANNAYAFSTPTEHNFEKGKYDQNKLLNTLRTALVVKYPQFHKNIYMFIVFSAAYMGVIIFYFVKNKDRTLRLISLMLLFILASGASQLILPVIGSGHGDFGKHLFLLNLSYDIMFGISLLWIVHMVSKLVYYIAHYKKGFQ